MNHSNPIETLLRHDERESVEQPVAQLVRALHGKAARPVPAGEIAGLLASRFEAPLDFPPVLSSVVVGDKVVVPVAPGTLNGLVIARETANLLIGGGIEAANITILVAADELAGNESLPCEGCRFDPDDELQQAWLMAGVDDEAVHVSRLLFDADVVIPVGSFYGAMPRDTVCPSFCSRDTAAYLQRLTPADADLTIRHINENLGVFWQIHVVDGPGQAMLDILVGARRSVLQQAIRKGAAAWAVDADAQRDLVIVTLEGSTEQSWENARDAIRNADALASPHGAIALLTRIGVRPPAGWNRHRPGTSSEMSDVFERRHVYLYSQLPEAEAEASGFAPIVGPKELERLVRQYGPTTLVRDAHKVRLRWPEPERAGNTS